MRRFVGMVSVMLLPACEMSEAPELGEQDYESLPSGVTFEVLARGTYEPYHVKTKGAVDYMAKTKDDTDIVVREHTYAPGGHTGWHTHPGPVFITVTEGTLTVYEADDPTCTPIVVEEDEGYVDDGKGHIARNETGAVVTDMTVIIAPVGLPFRGEIDPPGNCLF